ncbi:LysR family transcriptional regulator [Pendulispora rubella]|uniref:LysR family transcriptional regulator n=1 Tax=Pendulispora rubella TaxID=2741070 RepID=A0ABZ2L755_9BACT
MDWNDLCHFLAVARTNRLTDAARQLHVSEATVMRRVQALERALRLRLFVRHPTGYFLTEDGKALLERATAVENAILGVERYADARETSPAGVVRIATPETLATHFLAPEVGSFHRRYPEIRLELVTGASTVNLARREADIALRLNRPAQGGLITRRVGRVGFGVYATPAFLASRPGGALSGAAFIGWDREGSQLPLAQRAAQLFGDGQVVFAAGSLAVQLAAAKTGIGFAVLPTFMAAHEPELVCVVPPRKVLTLDLWLVYRRELRSVPHVKAALSFLMSVAARGEG